MTSPNSRAPLAGIRVLDLTSVMLGPFATQNLGDLGAEVIKVESPAGDTTRHTGPRRHAGMAALFLGINRNKRCLVLDLKQSIARDALWTLIDTADVFVHSIRPQAVARLGFDPDAVRERNPEIVYAAIHGYGRDGPYAGQPAYDDVIVGRSGGADLMARLVGEPRYLPTVMGDKTCGLVATYAIMAALVARARTGRGDFVEIPMFETMAAFNLLEHLDGHTFSPPEGDIGYDRVLVSSRRPYRTKDGFICTLLYTDDQWTRFLQEVDRPDLVADPRFNSLAGRSEDYELVYGTAAALVATRTTQEWLESFGRLDIPAARVAKLDELQDDQHLREVGFFQDIEHPTEGALVMPRSPVIFDEHSTGLTRHPARLGEHSVEILEEAGMSREQIDAMLDSGATLTPNA